jgi:hypothetical protein
MTTMSAPESTSDDRLWAALAYVFSPLVPIILLLESRMPPPEWKRVSILASQVVPSRHGMHQPQLSCA